MNPQTHALRRFATPTAEPVAGIPLVRSTASLGWMREWRKARSTVDSDMPEERRKRHVRRDFGIFIEWMQKEDRARYIEGSVRIHGPFPHFAAKPPDIQVGDRGGTRPVARSIVEDTSNTGKEDYVIEAEFWVPEVVTELPTDLALELFTREGGRPGLRPLREKEWRGVAHGTSRS